MARQSSGDFHRIVFPLNFSGNFLEPNFKYFFLWILHNVPCIRSLLVKKLSLGSVTLRIFIVGGKKHFFRFFDFILLIHKEQKNPSISSTIPKLTKVATIFHFSIYRHMEINLWKIQSPTWVLKQFLVDPFTREIKTKSIDP